MRSAQGRILAEGASLSLSPQQIASLGLAQAYPNITPQLIVLNVGQGFFDPTSPNSTILVKASLAFTNDNTRTADPVFHLGKPRALELGFATALPPNATHFDIPYQGADSS